MLAAPKQAKARIEPGGNKKMVKIGLLARPHPDAHEPWGKSGAEATALQTLARLPVTHRWREAPGVRRVYRRLLAKGDLFSVPRFNARILPKILSPGERASSIARIKKWPASNRSRLPTCPFSFPKRRNMKRLLRDLYTNWCVPSPTRETTNESHSQKPWDSSCEQV
jgi:hypothetical protein